MDTIDTMLDSLAIPKAFKTDPDLILKNLQVLGRLVHIQPPLHLRITMKISDFVSQNFLKRILRLKRIILGTDSISKSNQPQAQNL